MHEIQHDEDYLKRRDEGVQEFFFRELSVKQRAVFWHTHRAWFAQKGYTLFTFVKGDPMDADPDQPSFELAPRTYMYGGFTARGLDPFPYADFRIQGRANGYTAVRGASYTAIYDLMGDALQGMHFFALDSLGRHVALKFIPGHSQEFRVLKFLHQQHAVDPEFCTSIISVLELIPYEDNWFVVMPRYVLHSYKHHQSVFALT